MKHEFFDHHREGDSIIHKLDPRLKLLIMTSFIFLIILIPYHQKQLFLFYGFMLILTALLSRVSLLHYLSKLVKLYPMIFFISIFLPFFPSDSHQFVQLGMVKIYVSGLQKFMLINIKSVLAMMMTIIMISTTDLMMILRGMEKLKIPKIFISILSFMYRFIFLLIDEVERMSMAYHSRYLQLPLIRRIKTLGQLMGMLFIRTYERGERIYLAMESRGFEGRIFTLGDLNWKQSDSWLTVLYLMILIVPVAIMNFR